MRFIPFLVLFVLFSCQSEKSEEVKATPTSPNKTVSSMAKKPELAGKKLCFERTSDHGGMSLEMVVKDDKTVEGFLSIESKTERINGPVKGRYFTEEYVLDFEYTIDGKPCMEKLLLNYTNRDVTIARSGSVVCDGNRAERNDGLGTMDLIPSVDCK